MVCYVLHISNFPKVYVIDHLSQVFRPWTDLTIGTGSQIYELDILDPPWLFWDPLRASEILF